MKCDKSHLTFQPMQEEDLPEVLAIEEKTFSQPWSRAAFLSALAQPDTCYLVCRASDHLLGYCGYLRSFEEADITNMAVAEGERGRGIGYEMLTCLMQTGRKRGIERYTLEVRISNQAAIHLYEKLGFHSVGIRKRFYDFPTEDACIMWTDERENRVRIEHNS